MRLLSELNQYRSRELEAKFGMTPFDGHDDHVGFFLIKTSGHPKPMRAMVSRFRDHEPEGPHNPPWNHVSVSRANRCPTWEEMCLVKDLFFAPDEVAMQLHPAHADYVSNHEFCLHIWQPAKLVIPLPPASMVGIKDLGTIPHKKR